MDAKLFRDFLCSVEVIAPYIYLEAVVDSMLEFVFLVLRSKCTRAGRFCLPIVAVVLAAVWHLWADAPNSIC
jgi:hypothetical protein